ncbi:glycosyltransferase [Paenibacillus sp. NPDC057934]|uniref:GAP1-N2 domain-containing protein n=1 Tax=Paenibacillus sp. NPDC057934 TaxID=3346282 RepID=UPI0036DA8E96
MKNHSGAMITQQMYTRERRGIFRSTEGFDTVAKSEGLDGGFIKKILHPFCLYDAPAELTARGEKAESAYPSALHLFHTENGETVIGNSRYQSADFTGQRSAFFAHNFVVPAARAEEVVEHYGDWLHADFAGSYTGELGGILPELSSIPVGRRTQAAPGTVLSSLNIGEDLFKALLQAVMTSVAGKKKIYIALDVPIGELSKRAAELTEVIFGALPNEFRRRLGVITYANEPKSRKYIHLTFVEKGSLRPGDRNVEKDFTFDLVSGRSSNAEFGDLRQQYADLAWKVTSSGGSMHDFGQFADRMLDGESLERKLSLGLYNELAVFYEIEQGNESLYEQNKFAVLGGLLDYLKRDGALESRVRLNDIFLERFDREFDQIRQGGPLIPALMESFKAYYVLPGHNYRGRIVDYFINGMLNNSNQGREDDLKAAYAIIESEEELSAAFFKKVLGQSIFRRRLLEPYLENRLAAAASVADIAGFVLYWGRTLPEVLQQTFMEDRPKDYLLEKLQREPDPVVAVAGIHERVEKAEKDRRRSGGIQPEALELLHGLAAAADRFLLNRLSLAELTKEQLLDIAFLRYPKGAAKWYPPLDQISKQKENALRAAYRWFGEEGPDEGIFAELTPKELDDVQLLGRRWLKEARSAEPFERLPLGFYYSSHREGGPLDYEALLELVNQKAGSDKETVYRFLAWSQGNPLFVISNKKLQPGYRRAILKYFNNNDREAFKNRELRKTYLAAARPALQNVYDEARSQLASPLARWVSRSRFQILISGLAIGIVLVIAIIAISMLRPDGKDSTLPETNLQPSPVQTAVTDQLPVIAYLLAPDGEQEEGSKLQFIFPTAAECDSFKPAEISVLHTDETKTTYKVTATTSTCALPSSDLGDSSGEGNSDTGNAAGNADGTATDASPHSSANAKDAVTDQASKAVNQKEQASSTIDPAASPSPTSEGEEGQAVLEEGQYQVTIELEPGAPLAQGSTIEAGNYKLKLFEKAPVPSSDQSSAKDEVSPDPTATAKAKKK